MPAYKKHTIMVDGIQLSYIREGQGETIIFVHGITTYSFIWETMLPYFQNNYDIVAFDLAGTGDSDKPLERNISLKYQAELLFQLCEKLEISKTHLVCHDIGGGIGQIFAVQHPEMLYDLTLLNSVGYDFWPVQPIIAMRTPIIRQLAISILDLGMLRIIVERGLYHKEKLSPELMALFTRPFRQTIGRKGFLHLARCLDNSDLTGIREQLKKLSIPVLIIRGDRDVYLSCHIAEMLHKDLPNSKLLKIKTAGHFIQIDEPVLCSIKILHFIQNP